jgi:hypothetical protein
MHSLASPIHPNSGPTPLLIFRISLFLLQVRQPDRENQDIDNHKHGYCEEKHDAQAAAVCVDYWMVR